MGTSVSETVSLFRQDAWLANPGMGWQTFQTFADADRRLQGLPSSSACFRLIRELGRRYANHADLDPVDAWFTAIQTVGEGAVKSRKPGDF